MDKTATAAAQVAALFGSASPSDFAVSGESVSWTGAFGDWGLRRMVLHYAHLCAAAGGVDAFLIGSEMRGLTTIRSGASTYPAVQALRDLAADVRTILGASTKIGYAADWSEYFGHQPGDGSGDVFFHLDPLWADPEINFIGIDNYMPLSDWRDGFDHADASEGWPAIYDRAYLQANIAGGEGFDWFYASDADRTAQVRTLITDGAASKPWVFRTKDLRAWWSNAHYNRPGGVESGSPTAWVPQSKPIWFTELGCPAIDRGTNQPNVFFDPKSSESVTPHFSRGWRDDAIQRAYSRASHQGGTWRRCGCVYGSARGGSRRTAGRMALGERPGVPRGAAPDAGFDLVDTGDSAQAFGGDLGAVLLIDVMQLAPGMRPAMGQRQRRNAHAPVFGQGVISRVAIDLQDSVEARQDVHRMAAMAPGRIGEDNGGRITAAPTAVVAGQRPEVTGFGFAGTGVQHRGAGLVHEEPGRAFEVDQHPVDDRGEVEADLAAPGRQRGSVEIDTPPAVMRKMIGVFGHRHMGERAVGRQTALDQPVGRISLNDTRIATAAGIARADRDDDLETGGSDVEPLTAIFANLHHLGAAARADLVLGRDHLLDARQMVWQMTEIALGHRTLGAAICIARRQGIACSLTFGDGGL